MNEKEFEEALNLDEEMPVDFSAEKNLKKTMEKQINKRVFRSVLLIFLGIAGAILIISNLFDQIFYNPEKSSPYLESKLAYSDFNLLMDIYIGLNYPGRVYYPVEEESESSGFGKYLVKAKVQDDFSPLVINGQYNTVFEVKRNKLSIEMISDETNLAVKISEFYNDSKETPSKSYVKGILGITEEKIEEIEKLPESAVLKASISFPESIPLEETLEFLKVYPDSRFVWIGLDSKERFVEGTYDGINLMQVIGYDFNNQVKEKYPSLMLGKDASECTAEELEECYRSRLQILNDNPDFMKLMNSCIGDPVNLEREQELTELRISEIEEDGLYSIGVYGYIRKQDFLNMVKDGSVVYADIQDVKLSFFNH